MKNIIDVLTWLASTHLPSAEADKRWTFLDHLPFKHNVCFIKIRSKHSNTLVSLLRIFIKQTLVCEDPLYKVIVLFHFRFARSLQCSLERQIHHEVHFQILVSRFGLERKFTLHSYWVKLFAFWILRRGGANFGVMPGLIFGSGPSPAVSRTPIREYWALFIHYIKSIHYTRF